MERSMTIKKEVKMSKDTRIVDRVVEWLDANVEEQNLPYEVRLDSARLRDSIETWRHEL
jgi:hypothetical protein